MTIAASRIPDLLRGMFDAAVAAALPARTVPGHLPTPPRGRNIVLGAGKASAAMAEAVEDHVRRLVNMTALTAIGAVALR